jgi:hypothetical protein
MPIMIRPKGKPQKIAEQVLKKKGVKVEPAKSVCAKKLTGPILIH